MRSEVGPQFFRNCLLSWEGLEQPQRITDALFSAARPKLPLEKYSDSEIYDLIEMNKSDIIRLLFEKLDYQKRQGVDPPLEISSEGTDAYITWVPAVWKPLRIKLHSFAPKDFERFCGAVLEKLGGQSEVTGGTNDGGVDFIARGIPLYRIEGAIPECAKYSVIGQAKRYTGSNAVTVSEVRQFVGGAFEKIHRRESSAIRQGALSPVVLAFWTTSIFNDSSIKYGDSLGLWMMDGLALSQLAYKLKLTCEEDSERGATALSD